MCDPTRNVTGTDASVAGLGGEDPLCLARRLPADVDAGDHERRSRGGSRSRRTPRPSTTAASAAIEATMAVRCQMTRR